MPLPPPRYLTQPKACLLTDYPTHQWQGPWSCPWSPGGQAEAQGHEARRGPQVYWGLHAHAHGITRGQHGYSITREVASAHSWGPEAVGCGRLPGGPDPAGCLPPGQLREAAAGVDLRPSKGMRAG